MGIIKGLKSINKYEEEQEKKRAERDRPKTVWFKLADKQKVEIAFLQELDDESPNYSAKNGLGVLAVEHTNPENFRRRAVCSIDDEGACYGCEKHQEDYTLGWKGKTRLYINVLVNDGENEPFVAVMSQSNSGQSITPTLRDEAIDEGTISTKWFAISKAGKGTETNYTLRAKKEHGLNVEDYEVFNLEENVLRQVPYNMQEAHYLDGAAPAEKTDEGTDGGDTSAPKNDSSDSASVVW